jgi:hypothetical protein
MTDAWVVEVRWRAGAEWVRRFGVTVPRAKALHFIRQDVDRSGGWCEYRLRNHDSGDILGPDCFRFVTHRAKRGRVTWQT